MTPEEDDYLWTPIGFASERLGSELYWWQDEVLTWLEDSRGPVRGALCTPNGSGKSSKIVAIATLWWLAVHEKGRVVITTKDGKQLVAQIWESIEQQQAKFPKWKFLKSERRVENGTGGWCLGFTTDEPGRAEGWHKLNDEDGPLLIIVDEAKSVAENIFSAIDRCTFNALLYTSSPGLKSGTFYKAVTDPRVGFKSLKVGLKDCPHIPEHRIAAVIAKYGEDHPFTLSTLHGEFMDEDEDTRFIVPPSALRMIIDNPPPYSHGRKIAFCDFAAGGDENVLALKVGNRVTLPACWRDPNTMAAVGRFIQEFVKAGLVPSEIYGDNSGLGKVMIDRMHEMGWPINRVDNGASPRDSAYYNRGAEIWFTGSNVIQRLGCILPDDEAALAQLSTRKAPPRSDGLLQAEEKKDMKKRGLPSPDRADAIMGTLAVEEALENTFFDTDKMTAMEAVARVSRPEHGAIELAGNGIAYHSTSANPWLKVWERPTIGMYYTAVLNPPRREDVNSDIVFFILRSAYRDKEGEHVTRLACRLSVPCRWDAGPLAEMVSRVVKWYGFPVVIPIVNDRGDVIHELRKAGVAISARREFERSRRGGQTNVIQYGWESTDYTRSLWISELSDAIRGNSIQIEDIGAVMELFQLSGDNAEHMRQAEAIGVALKNITFANKNQPAPANLIDENELLESTSWRARSRMNRNLAIT